LGHWDYFQVSPNDDEPPVSENDEDEVVEKVLLQEKANFSLPEQYVDKSNRLPVQKSRGVSTTSKNCGKWVVVAMIFMIIAASVIFYLSHTSDRTESNISQKSFSVLTVSRPTNKEDSAENNKISQAVAMSEIEKEILNGKIYSEICYECEIAQVSEKQCNQFVNDYKNQGKSYFIQQFKAYALSKLAESKAATDSSGNS